MVNANGDARKVKNVNYTLTEKFLVWMSGTSRIGLFDSLTNYIIGKDVKGKSEMENKY